MWSSDAPGRTPRCSPLLVPMHQGIQHGLATTTETWVWRTSSLRKEAMVPPVSRLYQPGQQGAASNFRHRPQKQRNTRGQREQPCKRWG